MSRTPTVELGCRMRQGCIVPRALEPDCWLHPEVEVRPSPIAGDGLFARAPIQAGTAVSRLGGRVVTWPELESCSRRPQSTRTSLTSTRSP